MSIIVSDLIEGKLFELMERSSFEALSTDEKELVENHFSEEEYTAQRSMMIELEAFESEAYKDEEPSNLILEPESKSDSKIKQLFNFKIPGYAVAIMLVVAFGVPQLFQSNGVITPDNLVKTETQDSTLKSTELSLAKIHPKDSIITEPEQRLRREEISPELIAQDSIQTEKLKYSIEKALKRPKGKSATDDPYAVFYSAL